MKTKQQQPISLRLLHVLRCILFDSALLYLVAYLWVAGSRISYPFELEWIEGGMVDQVQRIVNGESVYVAPSLDFVPFLYPPGYFYLSALASIVLGGGFFPLRMVSFIASLVSFGTIFMIVHDETGNWGVAFLSTCLFAATFRVTGAWLDIARVDSLFLALWLLFVYFVRSRRSLLSALVAGTLVALAFMTKQTALIACFPIVAYLLWQNWKYALSLLTVAGLIVGGATLVLDQASAGWYTYYVFELLFQQTEWLPAAFVGFWRNDLLVYLPVAIYFIIFFFIGRLYQDRLAFLRWLSIFVGALAGTFVTRVKVGGYDNVLLLVYAVIAILFGLSLDELLKVVIQLHPDRRIRGEALVYIGCLIQLIILFYNPLLQIPTESDLNEGYELVAMLSEVDGEVYLPDHGYLPTMAGKRTYAHQSAIWDVMRGQQETEGKTLLTEDLDKAIREQTFDIIIFDSDWNYCCREIGSYYTNVGEVFQSKTGFYPVTGWRRRPTFVYTANRLGL